MKKNMLTFIFLIALILAPAYSAEAAKVAVDGRQVNILTVTKNDTILVPLRTIFQALGAGVNWDEQTQTVTANKKQTTIELQIGSKVAYCNGNQVLLQTPGKIVNGNTMVPLRFVSEALGAAVDWNKETQTITILSNNNDAGGAAWPTEDQLGRAISCSAVYNISSEIPYDLFMVDEAFSIFSDGQEFLDANKEALSVWWGINDREDALNTISWLKNEGHREFYNQILSFIAQATDEEYQEYADDEEYGEYIHFVQENRDKIGEESLLAWDYCRLVGILQNCHYAGYISREEAVTEIMNAAKVLQENFDSWEAMAQNHLLGRKFWDKNAAGTEALNEAVDWLLTNEYSPWIIYQWDYPLE